MNILELVMTGLSKNQKTLPAKLLYDKKGSEFFKLICDLPEYYPTKAEKEILQTYAREMTEQFPDKTIVIEPGSGAGEKIKYLLKVTDKISTYVPIEISKEILSSMTKEMREEFPSLQTCPILGDFTSHMNIPSELAESRGRVIFFPGSTIGNFNSDEAGSFLEACSELILEDGGLLIGVDLKKDRERLNLAYDDSAGVTAKFNLNILERLNRDLKSNFDQEKFLHSAFYNVQEGRVEMHLKSRVEQFVKINNTMIKFNKDETIHTESSYKYTVEEFIELCANRRLRIVKYWKDSKGLFCVFYFKSVQV